MPQWVFANKKALLIAIGLAVVTIAVTAITTYTVVVMGDRKPPEGVAQSSPLTSAALSPQITPTSTVALATPVASLALSPSPAIKKQTKTISPLPPSPTGHIATPTPTPSPSPSTSPTTSSSPVAELICVENTAAENAAEQQYNSSVSSENSRHSAAINSIGEYYNSAGLYLSGAHLAAIASENSNHQNKLDQAEATYVLTLQSIQPICT